MQQQVSDAEITTSTSIVETERTHLNHEEQIILREALRPGADISVVIPDDASADELWRWLSICIRGTNMLEAKMRRLHPVIGRILLAFQNKPSLYKDLGYDTFTDFMEKGAYGVLGLSRSHAWLGKKVARDWPQLGPDRFARIGPKKIEILSKFSTGRSPNAELLLQAAERMKVPEFRQYVEQRGFIRPGESTGRVISFTTNGAIYDHFKEFFSDPRVQAKVGSKDYGEILEVLIQESSAEWFAEGEHKLQQGGK